MSRPQDVFGGAPKSVLNKPYMQVQYRLPQGQNGGSTSSGLNRVPLNTVVHNYIAGASLVAEEVTLPAGRYYIEVIVSGYDDATSYIQAAVRTTGDANVIQGTIARGGSGEILNAYCNGETVFNSSTTIKLELWITTGQANGFGPNPGATGLGDWVSGDLRIWQLDADISTPVATSSQSYNGGTYLTGGINGLELEKTGDNIYEICMERNRRSRAGGVVR